MFININLNILLFFLKIAFEGKRGESWSGDIALDDILVTGIVCIRELQIFSDYLMRLNMTAVVSVICQNPNAMADDTNRGNDYSRYHAKPNPIIIVSQRHWLQTL